MNVTRITAAALALAALIPGSAALAHASFETPEAAAGTTYKAVLRIPHGCEGQATEKVHVRLPEGVFSVKPMPKAGWGLETVKASHAKTYMNHGKPVSEGVTEITWTGVLPDEWFDEFSFRGTIDPELDPGTTLYFVVTQTCADGEVSWSELPDPANPEAKLDHPAVGLTISAPEHKGH
ncbi:DUF1775 domain-containing protein [Defluviimonas sp. WL0024]|uniref:DUF1775 domain-containing protein n=1 Tax=Albidovulum salinarum TaxID=2984153 RepID=A0ABT2X0P6_9RHOB|nr:DUF1775 domain-containing protein [Defluviimonas sp. WL0024]MCU9846592.1 DUF1775 domain-containing protein [Defluviimonas sp. WL0024]